MKADVIELVAAALAAGALSALGAAVLCARLADRRLRVVAHASHELRGALAAIQLAIHSLERRGRDAGAPRSAVEALQAQADRAVLAVDDLDSFRLAPRAVRDRAGVERVELGALVRRRVRVWRELAPPERHVALDWRVGTAVVCAHPERVGQAIDNLIANALEHGAGSVTIEGRADTRRVFVTVTDEGTQGRVGDSSAEASWRRRRGHGLSIVRHAVERHGGRLVAGHATDGWSASIELPRAASG